MHGSHLSLYTRDGSIGLAGALLDRGISIRLSGTVNQSDTVSCVDQFHESNGKGRCPHRNPSAMIVA